MSLKFKNRSDSIQFSILRLTFVGMIASCLTMQSGCITLSALMGQKRSATLDTTMLEAQGYSIPPGGMPSPVAPSTQEGPRVVLEVRDGTKHLESIPLPTDRGIFIEDLVGQARLPERLGNMNISIMRPNGSGNPPIRLDVRIDDEGKATNIGNNYALLPGDHIIVVSDRRTGLEKFIDSQFRK